GTHRMSNLVMACKRCNVDKKEQTAEEWRLPAVQAQARRPLKDAAMNASRWALYHRLLANELPVDVGTGGRTTWNGTRRGRPTRPNAHGLEAGCVGASAPERVICAGVVPVQIRAMARHSRQMCRTNAAGSPDKGPKGTSVVESMRIGDLVRAVVPP